MKKFFTSAVAAGLVCAAAGVASASTLETSGEYRARIWSLSNFSSSQITAGVNGDNVEFWDQRLRLNAKWVINENANVAFRADILEGFWGDKMVTGFGEDGKAVEAGTKDQIAFDRVWGWVKIPNTPVSLTIGRQDVTWGVGFLAAADNRDRFKAAAKFDPVTVVYAYDKSKEAFNTEGGDYGDAQAHTLGAVVDVAGWNAGLLLVYQTDDTQHKDKTVSKTTVDVYGKGAAGPVKLAAEVAFAAGKNEVSDTDISGLGAYLGATVAAGPANIGVEVAYAAGDDPDTADENEGGIVSDYQSPFWSIIMFNNFDYNGYGDLSNYSADTSVSNALAAKVSVTVPAGPVTIGAAAVYAARDMVADDGDKPLGTEIDLWASVPLAENTSFLLGCGYLMPGAYFDGTGENGDDPDAALGLAGMFTWKL